MITQLQKFADNPDSSTSNQLLEKTSPKREPVKHLLIGSPHAVTTTMQRLHAIGYASIGDWSPLLPTANPGEVMTILIRQIFIP
ncbi:hypothetical protein [Nostoc sp. CMAA1605]|uniref:hypothetical protein n=1 Tax=Nostoc sp. CMAA1605 TaxID=2055159 RepID=UPI001F2D6D24|nr:hypothetical protein [Nostoc sp. CMAA1605]MCF4968034.1 hypothetical protein [Nostoc sp. CMAA1605]